MQLSTMHVSVKLHIINVQFLCWRLISFTWQLFLCCADCTSIPASYNQIIFLNTTSEEMCFYALAEVDNCIEWQETYTLSLRSNNTNAVFTRDLLITVVDISGKC